MFNYKKYVFMAMAIVGLMLGIAALVASPAAAQRQDMPLAQATSTAVMTGTAVMGTPTVMMTGTAVMGTPTVMMTGTVVMGTPTVMMTGTVVMGTPTAMMAAPTATEAMMAPTSTPMTTVSLPATGNGGGNDLLLPLTVFALLLVASGMMLARRLRRA